MTARRPRQHSGPDVAGAESAPDLVVTGTLPAGFRYRPEFIDPTEEQTLLPLMRRLPFRDFEFHGFTGKRRVVSFGWRYDFNGGGLMKTEDMPSFLFPLRHRAAAFAGLDEDNFQHALITEYGAGAAIGWHKDRSVFGTVVGVSLHSPCTFRLRRRAGRRWERCSLTLQSRSIYLLRGASRNEWEHSIPPVDALRYSITFRDVLKRTHKP